MARTGSHMGRHGGVAGPCGQTGLTVPHWRGRLSCGHPRSRRLTDGQVNRMPPRIPRGPGLPFGGGLNLVLAAGAAYFVWEHGQGRHGRPHLLCSVCWLEKVAPAPKASEGPSPAEPPEQA